MSKIIDTEQLNTILTSVKQYVNKELVDKTKTSIVGASGQSVEDEATGEMTAGILFTKGDGSHSELVLPVAGRENPMPGMVIDHYGLMPASMVTKLYELEESVKNDEPYNLAELFQLGWLENWLENKVPYRFPVRSRYVLEMGGFGFSVHYAFSNSGAVFCTGVHDSPIYVECEIDFDAKEFIARNAYGAEAPDNVIDLLVEGRLATRVHALEYNHTSIDGRLRSLEGNQTTIDNVVEAMQNLPDGQAVSAQVAIHDAKISNIEIALDGTKEVHIEGDELLTQRGIVDKSGNININYSSYRRSDYIDISSFETVSGLRVFNNTNVSMPVAIFDESKKFLAGVPLKSVNGDFEFNTSDYNGAKYLIITGWSDGHTNNNFVQITLSPRKVVGLNDKVSNIEKVIENIPTADVFSMMYVKYIASLYGAVRNDSTGLWSYYFLHYPRWDEQSKTLKWDSKIGYDNLTDEQMKSMVDNRVMALSGQYGVCRNLHSPIGFHFRGYGNNGAVSPQAYMYNPNIKVASFCGDIRGCCADQYNTCNIGQEFAGCSAFTHYIGICNTTINITIPSSCTKFEYAVFEIRGNNLTFDLHVSACICFEALYGTLQKSIEERQNVKIILHADVYDKIYNPNNPDYAHWHEIELLNAKRQYPYTFASA